jgi:serine protease inhibitor
VIRGVAAIEPAVSPGPYAAADLAFGLSLLAAACTRDPDGNLVLSPASLAGGLGMAYLGAQGETARAMRAVLHLPAVTAARLEAGLQARTRALASLDGPGVSVAGSDRVWTDPSLLPLRGYLNAVATSYGAGVGRVPLNRDPATAAARIDAAVAAATRGHIPHLLTAADVTNTVFVLTDAVYLNARWASPFLRAADSSAPFSTAAGQQVTASYLNGGGFPAATSGGWTAVRLPYRGGRLAMTALLPPAGTAGRCLQPAPRLVAGLAAALGRAPRTAAVELPKVSLRSREQLKPILTGLGMGPAFAPVGDFGAMSPATDGIGAVVHAATLRVDSAGTVASAATAVTMEPTAAEAPRHPVAFTRPYLMLITDTRTGEPLFLARVANPDVP